MFENEAEEYVKPLCKTCTSDVCKYKTIKTCSSKEFLKQSFQDGAELGYNRGLEAGRPKWHDLRKDPDDLPSRSDENKDKSNRVITDKGIGFYYFRKEKWYTSEGDEAYCFERKITAWCEILKYTEEE